MAVLITKIHKPKILKSGLVPISSYFLCLYIHSMQEQSSGSVSAATILAWVTIIVCLHHYKKCFKRALSLHHLCNSLAATTEMSLIPCHGSTPHPQENAISSRINASHSEVLSCSLWACLLHSRPVSTLGPGLGYLQSVHWLFSLPVTYPSPPFLFCSTVTSPGTPSVTLL